MTAYELMIKTNHFLIKGGELTEPQKQNVVRQLMAARTTLEQANRFYNGVKYPNNTDSDGRQMYPLFFIPPYNDGKKLQTVIPLTPKTHILSANSYELEILRLSFLFTPDEPVVIDMVNKTLERLKTTCFGYHDCDVGECFHSALIVLRFLGATSPYDHEWINKLIRFFYKHMDEKLMLRGKGVHGNVLWYYWLCLSELPLKLVESEIIRYKDKIISQLNRSSVMNNENDKINHPVMICMLRNCLSRLPEYAYIIDRQPYIKEKDGRLYFDMSKEIDNE